MKFNKLSLCFCFVIALFGCGSSSSKISEQLWSQISNGYYHSMAVSTSGKLYVWGGNDYGQLGDGSNEDRPVPTLINFKKDILNIAAGYSHSLVIDSEGYLWAWGNNDYGQLGDASLLDKAAPIKVGSDNNWFLISAGYQFSIGIKIDGSIWSWGADSKGQLGRGLPFQENRFPIQIGAENDWSYISCGDEHTLALKNDGTLWAWGDNGRVGSLEMVPLKVSFNRFKLDSKMIG